MRGTLIVCVSGLLWLAGCRDAALESELAATKARLAEARQEAQAARGESTTAAAEAETLRRQLRGLNEKLDTLSRVAPAPNAHGTIEPQRADLQARIRELEQKIAELEAASPPQPAAQPKPEAETPAQPDATVLQDSVKRIDALLPLVKSDAATGKQRDDLLELLFKSDRETRDRVIGEIQKWVADEPANKQARLALASVLVARFADLKKDDFMGQATLAGQITDEAQKALELDPEFYEAVAFLALMKVEYPTFSPEFKAANKDLNRALELQAKLTWEERFAEVYVGYSTWYRKQGKLDEAAAKCQAGLDKSPRHEGLLAEQTKVEEARKPATGE